MARKKKTNHEQSSIKGKLLEMVVAGLHEAPGVKIERNVRLPTLRNSKRKREIDVLISGFFSGYPLRVAIECKNRKKRLDVEYIDAYIGKLNDIGIPTQQGIYVSPVGFTKGAIERANEVGITPLLFTGLTSDRLAEKIDKAFQAVIYLLVEITNLLITCNVKETENSFQLWLLYDQEKNVQGLIPDLVWKQWIDETLPSSLGEHDIKIKIPDGLRLYIDGKFESVISAEAKIKVVGLSISISGKVTEHALINPINQQIDKFRTSVSFDTTQNKFPINTFNNEGELENFLAQRPEKIKLTIGRIRLPRIRYYSLYWPLSERSVIKFASLAYRAHAEGRKISDEELASIEGSDLKTIWDPIWSKNPMIQSN